MEFEPWGDELDDRLENEHLRRPPSPVQLANAYVHRNGLECESDADPTDVYEQAVHLAIEGRHKP